MKKITTKIPQQCKIEKDMNVGDTVYFVENRQVRQAEVMKITKDFVTIRFQYVDPNSGPRKTEYKNGGLRLRRSRLFESKEEAERSAR